MTPCGPLIVVMKPIFIFCCAIAGVAKARAAASAARMGLRTIPPQESERITFGAVTPKPSLLDYLAENAERHPDRVAIHFRDQRITYREVEEAAARCRGALAAHGVKAGDRVALVMSDSPEMVVAFLGIMGLGAIAVPCSTALPPEGLAYVFKDSEAKLVIVTPEHEQNARAAGAPRNALRFRSRRNRRRRRW